MNTAFVQDLPFPEYTAFSVAILVILLVALIVIVAFIRVDRTNARNYEERNGKSKITPSDVIIGVSFILIWALIMTHIAVQSIVHAEYTIAIGDLTEEAMAEDIMTTTACAIVCLISSTISWKPFRVIHVNTAWWVQTAALFALQCILGVIARYAILWG